MILSAVGLVGLACAGNAPVPTLEPLPAYTPYPTYTPYPANPRSVNIEPTSPAQFCSEENYARLWEKWNLAIQLDDTNGANRVLVSLGRWVDNC